MYPSRVLHHAIKVDLQFRLNKIFEKLDRHKHLYKEL